MTPTQTLEALIARLDELTSDSERRWGVMSVQHMVEHLAITLALSNGKIQVPLRTPEAELPAPLAHLWSDKPIPKGVRAVAAINEPLPLRFANLDEARAAVQRQYAGLAPFFVQNPDARPIHPVYGPLDLDGWIRFHVKHFEHHYRQFSLLPDLDA
jgi:hypothetical protein